MLFELLPHFARLVPMAEKFFATRGATDREQQAALTAISSGLRVELTQVAEMHAGIERQLQEQGAQVGEIAANMSHARLVVEAMESRIAKLETTSRTAMRLLAVAVLLLAGTLAVVSIELLHTAHF